jgi:acyl-coenzyme A thioesterase PaaI-like protein
MYDMIRDQFQTSVPFAAYTGVKLESIGPGKAAASLEQTNNTSNHIASQHAGALFTLAEAASGAAMAGALAPMLMSIRPLVSDANIKYSRVAKGKIRAVATTSEPSETLLAKLTAEGKVSFAVDVVLTDDADHQVATMNVQWHAKNPSFKPVHG